jgi:hypothetical protein
VLQAQAFVDKGIGHLFLPGAAAREFGLGNKSGKAFCLTFVRLMGAFVFHKIVER